MSAAKYYAVKNLMYRKRSLMQIKNEIGPRTTPWGIPSQKGLLSIPSE